MNDVRVKDLMTRTVVTLQRDIPINEAAALLAENRISAAPVVEEGQLVGVLSESDVVNALAPATPRDRRLSVLEYLVAGNRARPSADRGAAKTVREAMTSVVFEISPESSIWEAATLMQQRGVKRLPVTAENGELVGIISRADLVRAMARDDEAICADVVHGLELLGRAASRVEAAVERAVVTLSGVADEDETVRTAMQVAARVPGVVRVRNLVRQEGPGIELELTEKDLEGLDPFVGDRGERR